MESSLRGSYLVRIAPINSNFICILFRCIKCLRKILCEVHRYPYISLSHTVHDREMYGICKGYVGGWYAGLCPRYGALFQ